MYYCAYDTCPSHLTMPLYCFLCADDEPSKHEHKGKIIAIKGDSSKLDWQNLRGNVAQTQGKAKDWFEKYGALIDLLSEEEFQGNSQLKRDHQDLATLSTNLNKYFADEIEKHLAKDEVLELQKREPKYKEFLAIIKRLEYLGTISAKNLWTQFRTSIPMVPLNHIFSLSDSAIALFSELKLISV